ncbi:Serine/threonine-protein kinase SRPK [Morus notabilis]|uniref:non-specific serine/threonine protein kinase n=1 Tax=Morus notabilis TaxID=981085 RepID=W9S9P9_9ROSA|nr:Serine/threonine-protein kinase SRPK [Morus notabilis]
MSCSSSSSGSEEDEEGIDSYRKGGYHAVRVGDQFNGGRYVAQRKLGWGQFSTVWLAYDTSSFRYVALKIQKSAAQFAQAALHEIEVLSAIAKGDPSNSKCVVRLIDHFKHTGPNGQHLCMVLEFLGDSLLRLIKYNRYKGMTLNKVREICKCILLGLDYLHRELGIIHTDLKLENILLFSTIDPTKDPIRSGLTPILEKPEGNPNGGVTMNFIEKKLKRRARRAVAKISERRASMGGQAPKSERNLDGIDLRCKVVDFGNACWADKRFALEIQTRQYRAPEVILQSGYSYSVDMWSFACIAFELATGDMMFTPKTGQGFSEDEDHLALMMELLGKIPRKVIKDMYDGVVTSVRTARGYTAKFPIRIGLHQGYALNPYLFTIVMDELTREIQDKVPWCILFVDDIVLVDEYREGVNHGVEIGASRKFRYLESIVQYEGDIEEDIQHSIKAGWMSGHTRMDRIRNEVIRSKVAVGGARSKDFFDRYGDLKRIRRLKYWSLDKLLIDKYKFSEEDARGFAEFLCPLLDFAPEKRPTAQQCLQHPWLNLSSSTPSATKNESNVEKLNIGMSNLRVTVGK